MPHLHGRTSASRSAQREDQRFHDLERYPPVDPPRARLVRGVAEEADQKAERDRPAHPQGDP
jgi:hypothetical protein